MPSTPRQHHPAIADITQLVALRHAARELALFPRMMAKAALMGQHQSRSRGRGMDFEEVRPYQAGDDIRTIDWRVTARTQTPHTKLFREERERPVLIVTDLRPSMFFGSVALKSVLASEVAACLGWAGLNANDRVGGLLFGHGQHVEVRPKRSHHAVLQLIHQLRDYTQRLLPTEHLLPTERLQSTDLSPATHKIQPDSTSNTPANKAYAMADILQQTRKISLPGSTVFVVSDFFDLFPPQSTEANTAQNDCRQHLFQLTKHCDLTLCQISDPLEKALPPPGLYHVSDGNRRVKLNTKSPHLREQFTRQVHQHQSKLRQLCLQLQMGLLSFETGKPAISVLRQAYSGRKRHTTGQQANTQNSRTSGKTVS